ncbi:uncharacterized protein ACRADG_006301 isoform 2-T2 [Cochliomyia hominivorax]
MELECDLSKITSEELLRKMWQQSEDANRKKEIRSQLYKLRESRLRDLYQGDIMAENTVAGFGKDPLTASHGDALADQSFQSLKSKEIRDSLSPTEMKFQSMTLNNPNTTGWNVQSSKEITPDGRGFRAETVATTDGVENINGGIAEFKGRNEQRSSAHHQGDDKNFIKKAMESSNSHLQEKVVFGDENSGRTEVRTSSSTSTSSSQVFQSSTNVDYDDGYPVQQGQPQKYLMDSNRLHQQELQQRHQQEQQRLLEEQRRYEQQFQQHQRQQEHHTTEQLSTTRQNTEQKNTSQNVQTQETHEQNKRYVDMDKASPEYQQHVQYLMQQPGEIISNTVEYPKPNVKMITTVKRLPDGTIVRNKRYETEEVPSSTPTGTTRPSNQTNQPRRDSQQPQYQPQQPSRNYPSDAAPHARPSHDMVDSGSQQRYVQDTHNEDVETKFSSIKKSSRKFSTETTSETIQEYDDRYPHGEPSPRAKPVTNDFSTHGFPSVRANKPTQEYPTERPHSARPTQGFPSQSAPQQAAPGSVVPQYSDAPDNISERRITTKDGEVIIVSSEKKRNYKTSSNSERIVETERVVRDDQPYQQIPHKGEDFSTHGFPSVREPSSHSQPQPKNYPSERQLQPQDQQDFPLDKFSPGRRIIKHSSPHGDDDVIVVSAQKSRTSKHSTNTERVIEHEIIRDDKPSGYPRIAPQNENLPYTVTTPGDQVPSHEYPASPRKPGNTDFSTQGFPSVRTPGQTAGTPGHQEPHGDFSTQGFPSVRTPGKPAGTPGHQEPHEDFPTQGFPSVRTPGQTSGTPGHQEPYGEYPERTSKTPVDDYTNQGYPSAKTPSRPAAGLPSTHPSLPRKSPSQDYSTQGFPSVRSPTKEPQTTQGYPAHVQPGRTNGAPEQPRAPTSTTTKTQPRTPSPQKYKTPNTTVREQTERIIRKEKEVDSAHRAFAASLRSSSPIDHVRRDSYTTDSHTRHTPRSSISSNKTFRRDMREGSHDSAAPSEISRISTTTVTRSTPPRTVGGRTVVTRVTTTKTGQGSSDTLNVTSPRATKSPSPVKSVTTTTTTTTRTVPKTSDNQHTRISTPPTTTTTTTINNIDTIFSINEQSQPQPLTSITKRKFSDNHKQPTTTTHKSNQNFINQKKSLSVLNVPTIKTSALAGVEEVIEAPCIKKHYYKLGPSDPEPESNKKTQFKISEKSPTKKQSSQPQPAPTRSRSSTPSFSSRKPKPLTDDFDDDGDDDKFKQPRTSPLSPTSRSKTPQKIAPSANDKPTTQDDWQTSAQPDNEDERRTVNRETTFDKVVPKEPSQTSTSTPTPTHRKPQYEQPNIEWVIVDDVDHEVDSDNDSFIPEVIDSKINIKKTSTKLITNEKQSHLAPTKKPQTKPSTTTTTATKQLPTKSQRKPLDKSPLKTKPQDTKSPQKPTQTPQKSLPKIMDNKPQSKAPTYASPQRKPSGSKPITEETTATLRKTLRSSQVIKDKTTKLIETEKQPKRKPLTPTDNKSKPQTLGSRKPKSGEKVPKTPFDNDDEPLKGRPVSKKPQDGINEPGKRIPGYTQPEDTDDEPIKGRSVYKKPQGTEEEPYEGYPDYRKPQGVYDESNQLTPDNRKPQDTDDEPLKSSPGYRKPQGTDGQPQEGYRKPLGMNDEPQEGSPGYREPHGVYDEPNQRTPGYKKPQGTDDLPQEGSPGYRKPHGTDNEPYQRTPGYRKPQGTDDEPYEGSSGYGKPHGVYDEPNQRAPGYRKPQDTDDEPLEGSPGYRKPQGTDDQPQEGHPGFRKPQGIYDEPNQRTPGYRKPQGIDDEPQEGFPGYRKPYEDYDEPNQYTPGYKKPQGTNDEPLKGSPGYRNPQGVYDEPNKYSPDYEKPQVTDGELYDGSPFYRKPHDTKEPYESSPGFKKPQGTNDEPTKGSPSGRKPPSPRFQRLQATFDQRSPHFKRPQDTDTDDEPHYITSGNKKPQDNDKEPIGHRPDQQRPQQIIEEEITITETSQNRYPGRGAPKHPETQPNQRRPGEPEDSDEPHKSSPVSGKPQDIGYEPKQGTPGYRKPQDVDDETYPGSPSHKKPQDTNYKPNQPGFKRPQGTPNEPSEGFPDYRKPQDANYLPEQGTPDYQKPQRTDDEPYSGSPSYRKPQETAYQPNQGTPGYRKPQGTANEPFEGSPDNREPHDTVYPGYRKPQGTDDEPRQGYPGYREPQDTKQGSPGYRKPQGTADEPYQGSPSYRKPEDIDYEPNQCIPGDKNQYTSGSLPQDTDEEPQEGSPGYRRPQHVTEEETIIIHKTQNRYPDEETPKGRPEQRTPGDKKPYDTDDEPQYGKPRKPDDVEPFETDEKPETPDYKKPSKPKSAKPGDRPEDEYVTESETTVRTSQRTVAKHIQKFESNTVTNKSPKPQKITKSPVKEQHQPQKKLPKTPGKETSPTRGQRKPGQKVPEEPISKDSKSPKHVSPTRTPKKPEDDKTYTTTLRTKQAITKKTTEQVDEDEEVYPEDFSPETKPKSFDTDDEEYVSQTTEFTVNTTQKRVVNEEQIIEFEEDECHDKKSPQSKSSPKKTEEPTGKRPQTSTKQVLSTHTQKKPEQKSPTDSKSPTRTPKKPIGKTPGDDDKAYTTILKVTREPKEFDDEEYPEDNPKDRKPLEPTDLFTTTTQKRVVSERLIKETEETKKAPKQKPEKDTKSPVRGVSPTKTQKKPNQEPIGRRPQSPTKQVSPTRLTKKPDQKHPVDGKPYDEQPSDTDEPSGTEPRYPDDKTPKSPTRQTSPTRSPKKPGETERTDKKPQSTSPTRGVSPLRTQKKPGEQKPEKPGDRSPQTIGKHVSPTRSQIKPGEPTDKRPKSPTQIQKKPSEQIPQDQNDEIYTTSVTTTRIVKEKLPKDVDDEDYPVGKPKERKPYSDKPIESEDDETIEETNECVNKTTVKRIVSEKFVTEFEEPSYPGKKSPQKDTKSPTRGVSPTRKSPGQKSPEKPDSNVPGKRTKSPNKYVSPTRDTDSKKPIGQRPQSPTRTQKQQGQKSPDEGKPSDKEPHSSTRTPKKPTVEDENFQTTLRTTKSVTEKTTKTVDIEEYPEERIPHQKGDKPKQRKPDSDKPYDTDEDEVVEKTTYVRTEKIIEGFEEPKSPRKGLSPTRGVSPTRTQRKPDQKPTDKKSQSPTRTPKKPTVEDETFQTTLRKTVTDKTTKTLEKGDKPVTKPKQRRPDSDKPYDTDEDEVVEETTYIRTERIIEGFEEPKSPTKGVSPTRKSSDKKPQSPTRTPKKPTVEDETFQTTLRSKKTVTEKTTKTVDSKGDKPESKPKQRKPHSDRPNDTDEDEIIEETTCIVVDQLVPGFEEPKSSKKPNQKSPKEPNDKPFDTDVEEAYTEASKHYITSKTQRVTEKLNQDYEEPESPRSVSPTRIQKKPGNELPEPTGKRPQSPLRTQKKPTEDIETFKTTLRTTITVTEKKPGQPDQKEPADKRPQSPTRRQGRPTDANENPTKTVDDMDYPDERVPLKRGDKPEKEPRPGQKFPEEPEISEPTGKKPQSPTRIQKKPTEDIETFKTTLRTTKTVTEKKSRQPDEKRHVNKSPQSPTRRQATDEDEQFETNLFSTKTVIEKTTKTLDDEDYPDEKTPYKRGDKPEKVPKQRPGHEFPEEPELMEPTAKRPQSPTRTQKKPTEDIETFKTTLRSAKTVTKKTTETVDDEDYPEEQAPYKQGDKPDKEQKPGYKFPEESEPTAKRPSSPTRTQKKPTEDIETFKTTLRTTKSVTEKKPDNKKPQSPTRRQIIPAYEDETTLKSTKTVTETTLDDDYLTKKFPHKPDDKPEQEPKQHKPQSGKPYDTDEEVIEETTRIITEKIVRNFEEPESPRPTQKKPGQPDLMETTGKRPQSPTRTQKKPIQDTETFKTTLRSTKTVTEKTTRTGDKEPESPKPLQKKPGEPKEPTEKRPKSPGKDTSPTRKPTTPKSYRSSETEEDERFRETTEFVIKSTQKHKSGLQESEQQPKHKRPGFEEPDDETISHTTEFMRNTSQRLITSEQHNIETDRQRFKPKPDSTKDSPKSPKEKSPTRGQSPTRRPKKPIEEDESYQTTMKTITTVTEKTTRVVDDEDEEIIYKQQKEPKQRKPYDSDEEIIGETTRVITQKLVRDFEDTKFPRPTQMKPGQSDEEEPMDDRTQSPTRRQRKPTDEDETTLRTITTVTRKTTKLVDDEDYPDEKLLFERDGKPDKEPKQRPGHKFPEKPALTPQSPTHGSKQGDKPEKEPKQRKPYSDKPYDTDEEEIIEETTCVITEKLVRDFEEPRKPSQKKPGQRDDKEPTDKRPQSPTRHPKKPIGEDESFKTTLRTEKTTKTVDDKDYPEESEPYTRGTSPKRLQKKPGEKLPQEPTGRKPQSPTRIQKKPEQEVSENDETFIKSHKTTIITKTFESEEYPEDKEPKPAKPESLRPLETDDDERFRETTEFVIKTTQKPKQPGSQEPEQQPKYKIPGFEEPDDETIIRTSEFLRNTSQRLIKSEQHIIETDRQRFQPKLETTNDSPKSIKETSPTRGPGPKKTSDRKEPKGPKSVPKSSDGAFKKTLRTTETDVQKTKPKQRKPGQVKPTDTDEEEEEVTTATEEYEIETCEKHYVTVKPNENEPFGKPTFEEPLEKKPHENEPFKKPFTSTFEEPKETIEGQTYPEGTEQFPESKKYPDNKKPSQVVEEPWLPKQVPKPTKNITEQFIETERIHKETPDGAFITKTNEPATPTSPTYRKKGTGRSDTFEERCRQILGMDTYGDTPGSYKKQPEEKEPQKVVTKKDLNNTTVFQVKIEDCDDEDEPLSINNVKSTLHKQIYNKEPETKEPLREEPKKPKSDKIDRGELKEEKLKSKPKKSEDEENKFVETVTKTTTIQKKSPKTKPFKETELDASEPETVEKTLVETIKETRRSEVKETKKSSPNTTPRAVSPTKGTSSPRGVSPTKEQTSPLKETPKRKPSKETIKPKTTKTSPPSKPEKETPSVKERLRSSTRKTKSPNKQDQVDGSEDSSPEHSPTRYTEHRRSSNISVTTEIIIEHTDSDTPSKKEKSPSPKKPKDSVFKDIIDSTVLPEKLTRRMPVTERKESAPVHRVTNRDKDSKMSRSTSENLIKVIKKPEQPENLSPKSSPKTEHRRPTKCFATKTINLSATDRLVNSEDMENVIIDIQHAKSSREPSPDKIVPTPVPADLDTGKPRYPDVVQEPEDDQPKRKPQVKNIPIFEEESNTYVGCHITEVNVERTQKTTYDSLDYEEQILKNPVVEAPPSLDYTSLDKPNEEESLLTVQEKVSRYQNITEEVKKPKTSEPFTREKFNIETEPKTEEENEEFIRNERIYTTIKLQPSAPQKSPELVRTISRHISRQNEPDSHDHDDELQPEYNKDFVECLVNTKKITKEFEVSHQQQQQQQEETAEKTETTIKIQPEKYQQPKDHDDNDEHDHDYDDNDDELIPHTARHTTIIEERRQKDILSRPSVFEGRNKKPSATTTKTTKTPLKCNKSPVKDSEKLRPDNKSRTKPTSAVTNTPKPKTTTISKQRQQQQQHDSPSQCKYTDIDYDELRGSGSSIETGVKNIISQQTKVYKNTIDISDDSVSSSRTQTNDLKNSTITTTTNNNNNNNNNKPEKKHMPVHLIPAKNSDVQDFGADNINDDHDHDYYYDNDDDNEKIKIVKHQVEEENDYDRETQVVNEDFNRETETGRKIPLTTPQKKKQPHSSTNSSPNDQPLKTKPKEHVLLNLTESKPLKTNTTTTTSSIKPFEFDDIDETTVLEPAKKKTPSSKTTKMMSSTTTTDSVAARRSLFESNNNSPSGGGTTPTKRTPLTSPMSGRRPSYMDHTKSSLEHTRRDSLEINKTNYSRKPSHPDEENVGIDRNSMVKFDMPHGKRATTPRATSITEDINVEEIFELEELEKLLESVQSYELRRRIRAQIRLIKKNQKNDLISSSTTEVTTRTIKTIKQGSEEPDTVSTTTVTTKKTKPDTKAPLSSSKKEYIFEETYLPSSRRSPKPNRYPYEEEEKEPVRKPSSRSPLSHSPERREPQTEVVSETTTKQRYYYKDEIAEHEEQIEEVLREISPSRKSPSPSRKTHSQTPSPERTRHASPEKPNGRSHSPKTGEQSPQSSRVTSSRSPERKSSTTSTSTSTTTMRKSSASYEQQDTSVKGVSTKPLSKRISTTSTTKTKPEDKTPVWADRKNILKAPSATTPKPKSTISSLDSRSGYTKTIKSSTTQKTTSKSSSYMDDDCVTSSYGIGPTDENGLPLFGIRALKKKKPTVEPSETTEVTGYVVEEKYYSDSKTKPTVERKEFIYSTNPEELEKLKEQVEVSSNRKALEDVEVKETRKTALITKGTPALRSTPDDDFLDSTTKYVRRGSVKEMSEKFIQREASSAVTEKSNNYPKAGLILRTNSRKNSRDTDNENENYETYKTTRVQQHHTTTSSNVLADSDNDYDHEEVGSRHSGRFVTESESECDSIKTQREFKQVTSTSSMATRSFLNAQGEEKVITNVTDCLERMRNADNVVEEGDTAEDQEARALLNKFLGASIIMKGVESSLPAASAATNRQSRIITTTTTSSTLSDDDNNNDDDNNAKHEVKTTRITKTIKSGNSSTPVTYTTCAIEEIWDEEILKELLEQARTYEERRKIRSRLRELMADREETKQSPKGEEKEAASAATSANVTAEEESSASEYEEIIEEVTDYSEAESDVVDEKTKPQQDDAKVADIKKSEDKKEENKKENQVTKTAEKSVTVTAKTEVSSTKRETQKTEQVQEVSKTVTQTETKTEIVEEEEAVVEESTADKDNNDKTDSSDKEQKQQKSSTSTTQKTETKEKDGAVVTTTTKVTTRTITGSAAKPVSPFAKFKQLDSQNSQQSAKSPTTPTTPGGGSTASPSSGKQPIFKFTDPALNARAATVKEQLLQWCQSKTQEYENVEITNFSTSWNNGLAFCALIHHFLPDAFDYSQLTPKNRRKNFELAFTVADEKAGIAPLLDVEDMVVMQKPDWKCVFVYVQSIYRRFRNCQ